MPAAAMEEEETRPRGLGVAPLCLLFLLSLFPLQAAGALKGHTHVQLTFYQETFPPQSPPAPGGSGEFLQDFDGEELLHVDSGPKRVVWRLPDFQSFVSFQSQGALGNMDTMKFNLGVFRKRSNFTRAQNVAPSKPTVYPKGPVEMGDPNVLVCSVERFSPPVLKVTWLKNGQEVSQGVQETDFYRSEGFTFRKFSYLPFVPQEGDVYVCQVEHWGSTYTATWDPQKPASIPETLENVVCGLGLAVGIVGVVLGPILFFKARKIKEGQGPRDHGRGAL